MSPSAPPNRWNLNDCTVLVTGGTSGIGFAVVQELLLQLDAQLVLTCSRSAPCSDFVKLQQQVTTSRLIHCIADVTTKEGRKSAVDMVAHRRLHGLVLNVGTNRRQTLLATSPETFEHIRTTNLDATVHLLRALHQCLVPKKDDGKKSSVVLVSSAAGVQSSGTGVPYGITKAAVNHLARCLACEWAPTIRVNAVAPWMTDTPLLRQGLADDPSAAQQVERAEQATPLGHLAQPWQVAGPVCFLLTESSSYVTGQVWGVDGGLTAQGFRGPCVE